MLTPLLLAAGTVAAFALFLALRRHADPAAERVTVALKRHEAIALAADATLDLAGVDVTQWRAAATLWSDDEVVHSLHRDDLLDVLRPRLQRWGLLTSWRVRFIGPHGTVLVGLGEYGDLITFEVDPAVAPAAAPPPSLAPDELPGRLARGTAGSVWEEARPTGEGHTLDRHGVADELTWWSVGADAIGLQLGVRVREGAVREVVLDVDYTAPDDAGSSSQARELLAESGSLLSAVLALVGGVSVLIFADLQEDWRYGAVLACVLLAALLLVERRGLDETVVAAYDAGLSWRQTRVVAVLSAALSGVVMLTIVGLSAIAGAALAQAEQVPLVASPDQQLAWGAFAAAAWLAAQTGAQALGRRGGWLRIAPELSDDARRAGGHGWGQAISVSLQSAIGEETVFRLLGVGLLLWLTDASWVAIGLTSVLWAAAHVDPGLRPRWFRAAELTLVGIALGALLLYVGLLAVLLAHFAHNLVLLGAPLIAGRTDGSPMPSRGAGDPEAAPAQSEVGRARYDATHA